MEFTAHLPCAFFTDEALRSLPGQTAPLVLLGVTVGTATVKHVTQSTLGPELTCSLDGPPSGLPFPVPQSMVVAAEVSLHRCDDPDGSLVCDRVLLEKIVYPSDTGDDE